MEQELNLIYKVITELQWFEKFGTMNRTEWIQEPTGYFSLGSYILGLIMILNQIIDLPQLQFIHGYEIDRNQGPFSLE